MVGFVLIIILVAVIGLIFLAISIRPGKIQESKEIENFLHSSLLYTTGCQVTEERVYDFRDLIEACLEDETCMSGENSCKVLNETALKLLENFDVGRDSKYKGYVFKIHLENETLVYLEKGTVSSSETGSWVSLYIDGNNVYVRLSLFY